MPDDEEEKMKKMRVRIERDAYSVLLSFKDGASPNQVEQRMDDTLGYTYSGKYHLAGVYDMSQILREHPKVRRNVDGKFKIIATEENQDLVALIAKQKDNKRKKGGAQGRGGRRAVTSIGHHHRSGLILRSSPKFSNGMRTSSSTGKSYSQKQFSNVPNSGHPLTAAATRPTISFYQFGGAPGIPFNRQFTFGTTPNKMPAPAKPPSPPLQRPLVRPTTASSVSSNSISLSSSRSTVTVAPPSRSAQPPNHIPSIKEFSDNAKFMMLKFYPESIHLSEMTERYSQEYDSYVEPLQLFSKSWMMLVKSTFKEWLQIRDGEVSLKEDWFARSGSAMKRSRSCNESTLIKISESISKPITPVPTPPAKLPVNQGFRYQIPGSQKKSLVELATQQMKGLTMGARHALRTPEKPPGLAPSCSSCLMVTVFPGAQSILTDSKLSTSNGLIKITSSENSAYTYRAVSRNSSDLKEVLRADTQPAIKNSKPMCKASDFVAAQKVSSTDRSYDAKQLRNLKMVEKTNALKHTVAEALNGKENPQLKKFTKKSPRTSLLNTRVDTSESTSKAITVETTSPPAMASLRSRFSTGQPKNRLFGQAVAAIYKQADTQKPLVKTESALETESKCDEKSLYVSSSATPTSNKNTEVVTSKDSDSDDGWSISDQSDKTVTNSPPQVSTRKPMLPPMSKGATTKPQLRSRPVSISTSISSLDSYERALHATLPDDEAW